MISRRLKSYDCYSLTRLMYGIVNPWRLTVDEYKIHEKYLKEWTSNRESIFLIRKILGEN